MVAVVGLFPILILGWKPILRWDGLKMSTMIRLELPLAPSANAIWKQGTGGRVYKSAKYKEWLEEAGWMVKQQTKETVTADYILQVTATRPDKRRRDLDNLLKATSDLLVRMRVIEDDNFCRAIVAEWADAGAPMVVKIFSLPEEETDWWTEIPITRN